MNTSPIFKFFWNLLSISSTLNVWIFHTNVCFGSFYYIHVTTCRKSCWNDVRTKNTRVLHWWKWRLGSISPKLYVQLLCKKIPKVQKIQTSRQSFALLGSFQSNLKIHFLVWLAHLAVFIIFSCFSSIKWSTFSIYFLGEAGIQTHAQGSWLGSWVLRVHHWTRGLS